MIKQSTIFSDRQFRLVAILVATLTLVLILINLFLIGGDAFVFSFNSAINAPMAIVITISAAVSWHRMGTEKHTRILWSGFLAGWALWALAEIIYSIYSIMGQEAPFPSIADFFWFIGYIPMGFGLLARIRTMPIKPNRSQALIIWGFSITTILLATIFVFRPTFQSFDPSRLIESLLNIAYPVEDCFLLIVVWRLFFTYEKGIYGFGWRLLAVGFIFLTIGDLVYLYANSTNPVLYYPDLKANLISRFGSDVPYSLSYLLWLLGIFALRIPPKEQQPVEPAIQLKRPQTYTHILIFTNFDDSVIDVSSNFGRVFEMRQVKGKSLSELLNISEQVGRSICEKVQTEKKVADLPIQIPGSLHGPQEAKLCGIAVYNPRGGYSGANLLLSVPSENETLDVSLNQENRIMVRRLLDITGSNYRMEIGQFLLGYYLPFFNDLYNITVGQGGSMMSQAFLDELVKTAKEHSWQIQFIPDTVLDCNDCSLDVLRRALPVLLKTAKQFVSEITDQDTVDAEMQKIDSRFDETIHKDVAFYMDPA